MSERIECPSCDGVGQHFTGGCPTRGGSCAGLGTIENVSAIQLDAAFNDGYSAAKEGFALDYCPTSLSARLQDEWQKGWHEWTSPGELEWLLK